MLQVLRLQARRDLLLESRKTSSVSSPTADSLHRPDSSRSADRPPPDTPSFSYQAATLGLQRLGPGNTDERRIPLCRWTIGALQKVRMICGLNTNHNHHLKYIFVSAAANAAIIRGRSVIFM